MPEPLVAMGRMVEKSRLLRGFFSATAGFMAGAIAGFSFQYSGSALIQSSGI